jgi:hypothetical protein
LQITTDEGASLSTETKEEVTGTVLSWADHLRLRIKEASKINVSVINRDESSEPIFSHHCSAREFRLQTGTKRITIFDKNYNQLGLLSFEFETANLVSKEESVKNQEKEKKGENELTVITVEGLTASLGKEDVEVYFRLIVGNSSFTTEVVKSGKEVSVPVKCSLGAEARENKLVLVAWEKSIIQDEICGVGHIGLDQLANGSNKITLHGHNS